MPTRDLEPLLSRSSWVRALAQSLAADPHAADDLVQDAWVAALERPPDDGSHLARWFAVVMQNFSRQHWRGEARRAARERSAVRDEAIESDEVLLERLELSRDLAAKVAALDEPYRTVLLLRYFEGLSPRDIARRLGLPLRTVHTRLNRALAKLRFEMGRDRERWQLALLPIFAAPGKPLGAVLLTTGTKVAAVAVALAGVIGWAVMAGRDSSPGPSTTTTLVAAARDTDALESAAPVELAPETTASRSQTALPPEAAPPPAASAIAPNVHSLRAWVVDCDSVPVGGLRVCLRAFGEADPKPEHCATSDARGAAQIRTDGATGFLTVYDDAFTVVLQPRVFDPHEEREQTLVVARVAPLAGVVVDENHAPLPGARVRINLSPKFRTQFDRVLDTSASETWVTTSDALGRFEIRNAPAITTAELQVSLPGYEDEVPQLTGTPDWGLEIVLSPMDGSFTVLKGRVVDSEHRAVEGAWVALGDASTRTDASGAFTLGVNAENTGAVLRAVKPGLLPAERSRPEATGEWPDPLVLQLGAESLAISGRVLDANDKPVAHAEILTDDTTPFGLVTHEQLSFALPATVESMVRGNMFVNSILSDEEGRFELAGLLAKKYRLYAFDQSALISTLTAPIDAGTRDLVIRLPDEPRHARIAGRVVSLRGDPVAGAEIALRREVQRANGADGALQDTVTNGETLISDAQGRFEFRGVSKTISGVDVSGTMLNLGTFRALEPGEDLESIEIRVPLKCHIQLDLTSSTLSADSFALLDASGDAMSLTITQGNIAWAQDRFDLIGGRSEVLTASEAGRTVVLTKEGAEVARVPVQLRTGQVNVVRP